MQEEVKPQLIKIAFTIIVLLSVGLGIYFYRKSARPDGEVGDTELKINMLTEVDNQQSEGVCVDVSGAVMVPGVYCLKEGDMVVTAINKAGGINYDSYSFKYLSRQLNLAERIADQQKIYIPFESEIACEIKVDDELTLPADDIATTPGSDLEPPEVVDLPTGDSCVDLNSATQAELEELPGIGEATAINIIEARPFTSIEQLLDVNGIGQSKYNQIKELVCI